MLIDNELVEMMRKEVKDFRDLINSGEHVPESAYMGKFKVVAEQKENMQVEISVQDYKIIADEPLPYGKDEGPSPMDLLLAGYAGCFEMTWLYLCSISNLDVEEIKVEISAEMDGRDSLKGPKSPPPRLLSMKIHTILKSNESEKKLERILTKARHDCSVGGSLHPDIEKEYTLEIIPGS